MTIEDGPEPPRRIPVLGYKPLIGVVHLPPLLSLHRLGRGVEDTVDYALVEARKYEEAGFDAVIIENYGDKPYHVEWGDHLLTSLLTAVTRELSRSLSIPVGVNVLRNDPLAALSAAYAGGGRFVRVNAFCEPRVSGEGLLQPAAAMVADIREKLDRTILVFADVDVKHSIPLTEKQHRLLADCASRSLADGFIVSGPHTGEPPPPGYVASMRSALQPYPVLLGSGVSAGNLKAYWSLADGFIVGTSVKIGTAETRVDTGKARRLASIVRELRSGDAGRGL